MIFRPSVTMIEKSSVQVTVLNNISMPTGFVAIYGYPFNLTSSMYPPS